MIGTQPILRAHLTHRCTFQKAVHIAGDETTYGHEEISYGPPETVAANVPCLMQPLTVTEQVRLGLEGTILGQYALYVLPQHVPASLQQWTGSTDHQVSDVRRVRGNALIDAGPFDIKGVQDEAGQGHHYKIILQRVT